MERLTAQRAAAQARQLHAYRTIAALRRAIDVPFLVVKGPALAACWYPDPSVRTYTDIDVLVARADFRRALDALVRAGFEELSSNWAGFLAHGVAEVPLARGPSSVDLHWDLIAMGVSRRDIQLDVSALFDRARTVTLGHKGAATLDPHDTLLHLCINAGLDGARRLLQLVDIDRVARSGLIEWDVFTHRARRTRAHALCAAVLQRTSAALRTPLPPTVLPGLAPYPAWLRINALVDLRRRSGRHMDSGIASGVLLASGRASPTATLASAARASGSALLVRAGRRGLTAPGGELDWLSGPAAGDAAASRHRYLQWVACGARP
jgi:hypothetical protein